MNDNIISNVNSNISILPRIGGVIIPEPLIPVLKLKQTDMKTGRKVKFEVAALSYYAETIGAVKADMDKDEWKLVGSNYRDLRDQAIRWIETLQAVAGSDKGLRGKSVELTETTSKNGVVRRKVAMVKQDPTIAETKVPTVRALTMSAVEAFAAKNGLKLVAQEELALS